MEGRVKDVQNEEPMEIDTYMTQDELKALWAIREKAFARVTLETANHLENTLLDGEAKETARRLGEVASEMVDAYSSLILTR